VQELLGHYIFAQCCTWSLRRPRIKVLSFILVIEISGVFAYFFHESYHNNSNAVTVVTAAFSILAGFLVAILGIGWDERVIRSKTWRSSAFELDLIKKDIRKHQRMFYLYLSVLALAFSSSLDFKFMHVDKCIDFAVLFFSCIALIYSFRLPGYLMRRNMAELDRIVRERQQLETSAKSANTEAQAFSPADDTSLDEFHKPR
jgi:hypothetical protein